MNLFRIRLNKRQKVYFLYTIGLLAYLVVVLISINQLAEAKHNSIETRKNTQALLDVATSQNTVLNAIKKVTSDTKLTADKQTSIIICMLQVPISQRTPDLQSNCRQQADSIPAVSSQSKSSRTSDSSSSTPDTGGVPSVSSSNSTPSSNSAQSNKVQSNPTTLQKIQNSINQAVNTLLSPFN